jgi:hypothetical protein
MSTWISLVGGMVKEYPGIQELEVRSSGHAVVDIRHEARDALVMHRDRLDIALALVQGVDELDIAVAAQPEDKGHLLPYQIVDDDLDSIELVGRHRSGSSEQARSAANGLSSLICFPSCP